MPAAWLVIDIRQFLSSRIFPLLLPKSKVKVLVAIVLRSHFSQFLLFSESQMMFGSSSPIHYTSVFSHAELDLPIGWLPVIVVFEIQALVETQSTHIVNFFALSSESPSFQVFSEISFIRKDVSVSLKRMTPNTVPSTFL